MRKSLLALLFAVALAVPALAENMWVGGSLGYESVSYNGGFFNSGRTVDINLLTVAPEFGYSLDEKWDIGLDLSYATGKGRMYKVDGEIMDLSEEPKDLTRIGIAPFARYHIAQIAGVDIILKGSIFYNKESYEYDDAPWKEEKITTYGIAIAPVISYGINETWSIDATLNFLELGYSHTTMEDNDDFKIDEFGFNVNKGSLINIGFSYHF